MPTEVESNGWSAVSINAKNITASVGKLPAAHPYTVQDIEFPSSDELVAEAQAFAKAHLSPGAYNHSMRVFYWGKAALLSI
jgi:cyanamide hydratase